MKTHSIKRFLIICITAAVLLVYAVIGTVSYVVSKNELDELYDAHLMQVAETIASQPITQSNNQKPPSTQAKSIHNEEVFYIRLLGKGEKTLYVSHPKQHIPSKTPTGFSNQKVGHQIWRVYTLKSQDAKIQVSQLLIGRDVTIKETALSLVLPQLLFIPLLVIVILMVIHRAFRPIRQLSDAILQRDSDDLTPFKMAQTPVELIPFVDAFNTFISKVNKVFETLKQFTADAAHELRTPITALKLQHTLICQAENEEERNSAISSLGQGVERSEKIVSQLLTLARISVPDAKYSVDQISLVSVIKAVIECLLPLAQAKQIDLGLNSTMDYTIAGAKEQIHLMVHNVLENAIRYTPEQGKVDIAISASDSHIILEIKDTGPGIADEDIKHVFERFYRGKSYDMNGSGLGLAIVKNIAALHNASIELTNLNPGLCFRVYFNRDV